MPLQKLRQKLFMNRAFAPLESSDFVLVIIDQKNLMTQLSKTCTCYKTNIS